MKNIAFLLLLLYFTNQSNSFAKNEIDPIKQIEINEVKWTIDNPKGKLKIRFIRNEDKSDTTNKPKGFFAKLKNVVNMLMDASDNPPFKVVIVREKEKKN
jgi:hypothetical protein